MFPRTEVKGDYRVIIFVSCVASWSWRITVTVGKHYGRRGLMSVKRDEGGLKNRDGAMKL